MDLPPDDPHHVPARRDRQRLEIVELISHNRLQRAADLAHEHLAEFPDDHPLRTAIVDALNRSEENAIRRQADEFADD